jgi:hypothetical protein
VSSVFWGHKCVLLGYTVTAECCGKLQRLPMTISRKRSGFLSPDVFILNDNAMPHNAVGTCALLRRDGSKVMEHCTCVVNVMSR